MDHFPLISSSQCYARSDQEDFSLPRVCSGLAYSLRKAGRSQRKGLSSHCRRRSGTKSQQQKDPGPWAQSHPRATASDFPFSDPIPSYDQDSSSPPPLTTTPSETPRFAAHRVRVMLPLPRLSKLGKHPAPRWEWEPPPRGALSSQPLPPYLLPTSGLLPGPNMAFLVLRPLPAITCQSDRL